MLPVEKNKQIIQQVQRIIHRTDHINQVKQQLYQFIIHLQQLYSNFSQKINKQMMIFQEFIIKNTVYSTQKSNYIVNMAKIYRQFGFQLERTSKINILALQNVKQDNIKKQQEKLKKKCELFVKQFQQYIQKQKTYNQKYAIYSASCNQLTDIVNRYRSYQNPIAFYNHIITNEYLTQIQKKHNECSSSQTQIVTNRQMLDEDRGYITQNIKQVNQNYFFFINFYLQTIKNIFVCIISPKNHQQKIDKSRLNLRGSEQDSTQNYQMAQLQRLDAIFQAEALKDQAEDNIFQDFSQLFQKSVNPVEVNSDYKLFHDRVQNIRNKRLKTIQQTIKLQSYLIQQLKNQKNSFKVFDKDYKNIQKQIFTNNGVDSFKKRFRKYFGSNYTQINQLCFNLLQKNKKSMQKICKNMQENEEKLQKLLNHKKQAVISFEKQSKVILDDHQKLKQKTQKGGNNEDLLKLKNSISESLVELKKTFRQFQRSQMQLDKLFFNNLKIIYQNILKQVNHKGINKILTKQQNRLKILEHLNISQQIMLILKQDSRYQNLLNQCPKPNLYSTFVTQIKKQDYQETKKLLQKKQARLKSMTRPQRGCCGVRTVLVKQHIIASYESKLKDKQKLYKGTLSISSLGLIFQQKIWNPFSDGLILTIPQTDIITFQGKAKNLLQTQTDFGIIIFQSQVRDQIIQNMQKHMTFRPLKQNSQKGKNKNDSSSFLKSSSQDFKAVYKKNNDKSNSQISTLTINNKQPLKDKKQIKNKSIQYQLKQLLKKWKTTNFFPVQKFTKVIKNVGDKEDERRDFQYKNGHSKFYLKQKRSGNIQGRQICFKYEWKVMFPQSPMLHSFKHWQDVRIQNIHKDMKIRIISGKFVEEQLYIRNKFYKQIQEMNKALVQFLTSVLQRDADVVYQPQLDQTKSVDSYNIVIDDIQLQDMRQSKFGQTALRISRLEKQRSSMTVISNK